MMFYSPYLKSFYSYCRSGGITAAVEWNRFPCCTACTGGDSRNACSVSGFNMTIPEKDISQSLMTDIVDSNNKVPLSGKGPCIAIVCRRDRQFSGIVVITGFNQHTTAGCHPDLYDLGKFLPVDPGITVQSVNINIGTPGFRVIGIGIPGNIRTKIFASSSSADSGLYDTNLFHQADPPFCFHIFAAQHIIFRGSELIRHNVVIECIRIDVVCIACCFHV